MRLVCSADLHGEAAAYRTLLALAEAEGARAVVVGGDLLPHTSRVADAIERQRQFVTGELRPLLEAFRARRPETEVLLLPGNDDWAAAVAALEPLEAAGLLRQIHERAVVLDGASAGSEQRLWVAGLAYVPVTPFSIKDYERRDDGPLPAYSFDMAYVSDGGAVRPISAAELGARPSIAEALEALLALSDPARTLYVCHTPPFDTGLDVMPRGRHVGGRAVRRFIERQAPLLTLHGHIHEAPRLSGRYAERIGPTWCVNPGHEPGVLHAVTLDTDDPAGTMAHTVYGAVSADW
jgi:Icc-related predicted phosphoesterase